MRWDFLISTQQNLFVIFGAPKELCSNGERKNDGALISIHRNPLAKSLLTIGILERAKRSGTPEGLLERAKRQWNARRLLERAQRLPPYSKMCELCELCELLENPHKTPDNTYLFSLSD